MTENLYDPMDYTVHEILQARILEVGKIPQSRKWQPAQVLLLENSMDRGAWQATVHGVTKSWTRLSKQARLHQSMLGKIMQWEIGLYLDNSLPQLYPLQDFPNMKPRI